jgi:hypothetical protein
LQAYVLILGMILNFLDRRLNTIQATCMSESLELAKGVAEKYRLTLQYVSNKDGEEAYPLICKGTHALWQKGGYKENEF